MSAVYEWNEIKLPLSIGEITGCDADKSGNAWIGTSGCGLFLIDKYNLSASAIDPFQLTTSGRGYTNVHSVYVDEKVEPYGPGCLIGGWSIIILV